MHKKTYKILHFSTEMQFRGGERQIVWLHEGMIQRQISSYLLCRKGSALEKMNIKNILIHNVRSIFNLISFIQFIHRCIIIDPYIIHCHDSRAFTYAYSNKHRGVRNKKALKGELPKEQKIKKKCSLTWAILIKLVYEVIMYTTSLC